MDQKTKTVFSAIQPSGNITIGNYLGVIKNCVELQGKYNCIFALADLHSITIFRKPKDLRKNTLNTYALLLACGINVEESLFFLQSQVNSHAQLAWILDCCTQFSELSRTIQFKDRTKRHTDNINCGLFSYPILMAADILLYNADVVPIGLDQKQHLELTCTIAERFNFLYNDTFKIPKIYISEKCSKIMSLQNPTKKMSKSDKNFDSWIALLDSPDNIIRKFKRAVTDSESCVRYDDINKPGISNLMTIYSCLSGKNFKDIEKDFYGIGYGGFKEAVGECVTEKLLPIQSKFFELIKDRENLEKCYKESAEKAHCISNKTLDTVKEKIGFIV